MFGTENSKFTEFEGVLIPVKGSGFRVQSSAFRVQRSGFGVQGSEFEVPGSGFGGVRGRRGNDRQS